MSILLIFYLIIPTDAKPVLKLNCGSLLPVGGFQGDPISKVKGISFPSITSFSGATIFDSHRYGQEFVYTLSVPAGKYDVELYFAETSDINCKKGLRIFDVDVLGTTLADIDVFAEAGCKKPYKKLVKGVTVKDENGIKVAFGATKGSAMISAFQVVTAGDEFDKVEGSETETKQEPITSPKASAKASVEPSPKVSVKATPKASVKATPKASVKATPKASAKPSPAESVEPSKATPKPTPKPSVKPVSKSPAPSEETSPDPTPKASVKASPSESTPVESSKPSPKASVKPSSSPETSVVPSPEESVVPSPSESEAAPSPSESEAPPSPKASPADVVPIPAGEKPHQAHAVPGQYDTAFIDKDKDDKEVITLDGFGSHSHYFNPDTGEVGVIAQYEWKFEKSGKLVCPISKTSSKCTGTFPLGATSVELCVTDNTDDVSCDTTIVTVAGAISEGAYCYYYNFGDTTSATLPIKKGLETGTSQTPKKPTFGAATEGILFAGANALPDFSFKDENYAIRCNFLFEAMFSNMFKFTAEHKGGTALYIDDVMVFGEDAASTDSVTTTGTIDLDEGLHEMEILYWPNGGSPQLELAYNNGTVSGNMLKYDVTKVLPIIQEISPATIGVTGGQVKITGSSLFPSSTVNFGEEESTKTVFPDQSGAEVTATVGAGSGTVDVVVVNEAGTSNAVPLVFEGSVQSISFVSQFAQGSGGDFTTNAPTSIALGPDFKYYVGTLDGFVTQISINEKYTVTSSCNSAKLEDPAWKNDASGGLAPRSVLGIAFNPKVTAVEMYVTTSTTFWGPGEKNIIQKPDGWKNGNVEKLALGGSCIVRDSFLITGLPVSNHDHSVNALLFDDDGNLRINVGGFTNMGVPGEKLGGLDENPLSGASLIALTSKGAAFDGKITYSGNDPLKAKQTGGDVSVWASGLRNSFGMHLALNGKIFATDNGPNKGFGDQSTSCTSEVESETHPDRVYQLQKGKFHGSANRNRKECVFVKFDGTTKGAAVPSNYAAPIVTMGSSTTGIFEYNADTFGGQMRGDLIMTKFENSGEITFRLPMNADGTAKQGSPDSLSENSGLSGIMGPGGEIITPQVFAKKIKVLVPQYTKPTSISLISVLPSRGASGGGTTILVTGTGFGASGLSATVGGKACTGITAITETSFKCKTPAGSGVVDVVVKTGTKTATIAKVFRYMNV